MKQKLNIFLGTISLLSLIIIGLVIFEVIPIDPAKLLTVNTTEEPTQPEIPTAEKPEPKKMARHLSYDEHLQRGDTLFENEYFSLAIKEYSAASQLKPESEKPFLKIGQTHYQQKNFDTAEKNFQTALKLNKNSLEAKINLGKTKIQQEKFAEAQTIFDRIKENNQTAKYYQAVMASYFGDQKQAQNLFREAIEINTIDTVSKNATNFLNSYEEFARYQGGKDIHLQTLLAKSYDQTENYPLAIGVLNEVLKEEPGYRDAWILLGYAYLQQEKYGEAKESLEEALALAPEKAETRYFLGLAYFGQNDLEKAILNLEIALQNGFQPQIQIKQKLAEMYLLNEDYQKAVTFYEQILDQTEVDVDFYVRPIWIYLEHLKQPAKALNLAQEAYDKYPREAMSLNLLGWAEIGTNDLTGAEEHLKQALTMDPNLAAAYLNLGTLYEQKKKIDLAKKNYKKAYELGQGSSVSNLAAKKYNELVLN